MEKPYWHKIWFVTLLLFGCSIAWAVIAGITSRISPSTQPGFLGTLAMLFIPEIAAYIWAYKTHQHMPWRLAWWSAGIFGMVYSILSVFFIEAMLVLNTAPFALPPAESLPTIAILTFIFMTVITAVMLRWTTGRLTRMLFKRAKASEKAIPGRHVATMKKTLWEKAWFIALVTFGIQAAWILVVGMVSYGLDFLDAKVLTVAVTWIIVVLWWLPAAIAAQIYVHKARQRMPWKLVWKAAGLYGLWVGVLAFLIFFVSSVVYQYPNDIGIGFTYALRGAIFGAVFLAGTAVLMFRWQSNPKLLENNQETEQSA
jgi:MFS family permease